MTAPRCPRDGAELTPLRHRGHDYHGCPRCGGLLLGLAMLPELRPLASALLRNAAAWPASGIACPQCGQPMHLARHTGVEIDLCPACAALWLDGGEIEQIRPRWRDPVQEQARAEAESQLVEQATEATGSLDSSGILDWLGKALGSLLSP